jgi:glycosyltransferase involved in cell wall biosynthesis
MLHSTPPKTNLSSIVDNRSGHKLEIVVPIFNEEDRLPHFLAYYRDFDIVFLDGGSTDSSHEIIKASGGSIFHRIGMHVGENHFVIYNNILTSSGLTFYMMIDEFIEADVLCLVARHLKIHRTGVNAIKREYLFCNGLEKYIPNPTKIIGLPRGFRRGNAIYDATNLHNSLLHSHDVINANNILQIHLYHLHPKSLHSEYGKIGAYLHFEVDQILQNARSRQLFIIRFVRPIFTYLFIKVWIIDAPLPVKCYRFFELLIYFLLSLMAYFELAYFPSFEAQKKIYRDFYN